MKRILFTGLAAAIVLSGCQKSDTISEMKGAQSHDHIAGRQCASMEVLQRQLQEDPSLQSRMDEIQRQLVNNQNMMQMGRLVNGVYEIPVVVNVLYKPTAENISLAQIQSQIDVLNEDFGATNADITKVPSTFTGVKAGNTNIRFVLETVNRKATTKTSWSTNDAVKKTASGGLDPTAPTTKLNLWCCTLGNGILGYAQFPGGASATDGVVILNSAFGSKSKCPTGYFTATYNQGRTATHEVGHWMNLRHIWGDATCGSDLVNDTPTHNTANYGCPASGHKSTCTGTPIEMTMNYMDYTDDLCMYMFSAGQKSRMLATFATGGGRTTFAQP
jgi:hypothetical protein